MPPIFQTKDVRHGCTIATRNGKDARHATTVNPWEAKLPTASVRAVCVR